MNLMITIVSITITYLKVAKTVNLKNVLSHYKKKKLCVTLRGDGR